MVSQAGWRRQAVAVAMAGTGRIPLLPTSRRLCTSTETAWEARAVLVPWRGDIDNSVVYSTPARARVSWEVVVSVGPGIVEIYSNTGRSQEVDVAARRNAVQLEVCKSEGWYCGHAPIPKGGERGVGLELMAYVPAKSRAGGSSTSWGRQDTYMPTKRTYCLFRVWVCERDVCVASGVWYDFSA